MPEKSEYLAPKIGVYSIPIRKSICEVSAGGTADSVSTTEYLTQTDFDWGE